jgi:hypothetical protein
MFSNIPFPKPGHEVLAEGFSKMLENLMKQKQLQNEAEYRNANLKLAAQREAREQKLSPIYEKYYGSMAKEHEESAEKKREEQKIGQRIWGEPSQQNQDILSGQPNVTQEDRQNVSQMKPGESYVIGSRPKQQPSPLNNQSSSPQNNEEKFNNGEEVMVTPPRSPQHAIMDQFPGSTIGNKKIPDIHSKTEDGVRYTYYPSGQVMKQKVGPSYEDKEQKKADIKYSKDLIETGKLLNKYTQHIETLTDLLDKPNGLFGATGNIRKIQDFFNLGGEDTGKFNENATPLVGELAKELSSRGGAVVSGMATSAKPNLSKSVDYNKSVVNELAKQTYRAYQESKKEYERINKKPYPIEIPNFLKKVKVMSPKGHIIIKSPEDANQLVYKYKGSKILGSTYE